MYDASPGGRHIRGVGAIIFDSAGRLLLVQRGHEPAKGLWTVPGGKVEPGETDQQALAREVAEETGLIVKVGALAGSLQRAVPGGVIYDIADYDATVVGGDAAAAQAKAGDDAADLRWAAPADLDALPLTEGLTDLLRAWGRLPAAGTAAAPRDTS